MKQILFKLSTVMMLTFGTIVGAELPRAAGIDEMWGKHLAFRLYQSQAFLIDACQEKKSMTLNNLLNAYNIQLVPGSLITIFQHNRNDILTQLTDEELAALGFKPYQNLGELPLSELSVLGYEDEKAKPKYRLSMIRTVSARENVLPQIISMLELLSRLPIDQRLVVQVLKQPRTI